MFSGVAFILLVAFMILFPIFLITRLRLTNEQKLIYAVIAIAVPVVAFIMGKLLASTGLLSSWMPTNEHLRDLYAWLFSAPILFGSWFVFVVATTKQRNPGVPKQTQQ
jgi:hypothetical protein